jgi:hypothetical protein
MPRATTRKSQTKRSSQTRKAQEPASKGATAWKKNAPAVSLKSGERKTGTASPVQKNSVRGATARGAASRREAPKAARSRGR